MKKLFAAVLASAFSLVLISALTFHGSPAATTSPAATMVQSCSCSAPDGSCSVSLECQGGCEKHCGNDGDCWAECSGFYGMLGTEITVEMQNSTYPQLVAELARISGKDLEFSPTKPDTTTFNVGFKRALLWDALEFLSDRGTVRIAGKDFESLRSIRKKLLSGERISFGIQNTPVNTFVNDMASLTGLPLRITAGRPMAIVNADLQDLTLDEILARVSEQTGTKITENGADLGPP